MKKFEWLLFDLDNTILDFGKSSEHAFEKLLHHINPDFDSEKLYPIYNKINHEIWDAREAGKISHTELKWKRWELFFKEVNIDFDPHDSNEIYFETIKTNAFFVEHAEKMLEQISSEYKSMIVTNGLSEVQWPRIKSTNLENHFDHIVISDEIGVAKPQDAFFEHCQKFIDPEIPKDKILIIGDTLKSDILGGNNFGIKTCWYNHYDSPNQSDIKADYEIESIADFVKILK